MEAEDRDYINNYNNTLSRLSSCLAGGLNESFRLLTVCTWLIEVGPLAAQHHSQTDNNSLGLASVISAKSSRGYYNTGRVQIILLL